MHCVTMNVYRAECVTELGSNNSEPERARAHLCEKKKERRKKKERELVSSNVFWNAFYNKIYQLLAKKTLFLFKFSLRQDTN